MRGRGIPFFLLVAILAVTFSWSRPAESQEPTQQKAVEAVAHAPRSPQKPSLILLEQYKEPVLTVHSPGAEDIKYGFEDGRVVKIGNTYHLITTEMFTEPFSVKTRIGYWTSEDRIHWKRISTLYTSSGDQTGKDPRASLWGPMPIYDEKEGRWDLIYVGYRSQPQTEPQWLLGYEGRIWRAVSQTKGMQGIGGPYKDIGVILEPGPQSDPWEGLQGTDSFFPYPVKDKWYGIYGSAHTEMHPVTSWPVGLATAPSLAGPWKRCTKLNPLQIEKRFSENPIVTLLKDGTYAAVYDTDADNAIGYAWSADGIHWGPGDEIVVQPEGAGHWANEVITPLGLIPEGNDTFTVFYTGRHKPVPIYSESMGFVTLKLK